MTRAERFQYDKERTRPTSRVEPRRRMERKPTIMSRHQSRPEHRMHETNTLHGPRH